MSGLLSLFLWIAAVLSLVPAAVYVNFALNVMPRLARRPVHSALASMQDFNQRALRPPFMIAFFGAALASVTVIVCAFAAPRRLATIAVTGAALSLAGFLITVVHNVPRNEALARVDPLDPLSDTAWRRYAREWGQSNRLRAGLSALAVPVLFTAAAIATWRPEG